MEGAPNRQPPHLGQTTLGDLKRVLGRASCLILESDILSAQADRSYPLVPSAQSRVVGMDGPLIGREHHLRLLGEMPWSQLIGPNDAEPTLLIVLKSLDDFGSRVHDERSVMWDRLGDRKAAEDQDIP
jgi:hypothetical protein